MDFSVPAAIEYACSGRIEERLQVYLTIGSWANQGLANGLKLQKRWWLGPILVPLSEMVRACGPETWMEYQMPLDVREQKVNKMVEGMTYLLAIPPLIAEYRLGIFSIRDGNHRFEAIRHKGWLKCWVIIRHNSEEDWMLNPYTVRTTR